MKVAITYEQMLERYPDELGELVAALRGSKSVQRQQPAEDLTYAITWVRGFSAVSPDTVRSILGGTAGPRNQDSPYGNIAPDEITMAMVRDVVSPSIGWSLMASKGHWHGSVRGNLAAIPDDIIAVLREEAVRNQQRRIEWQAMTPEQQQDSTASTLRQLSGQPGFMIMGRGR